MTGKQDRVFTVDEETGEKKVKSNEEIVRENELLSQKLSSVRRQNMIKEAIRENKIDGLIEQDSGKLPDELIEEETLDLRSNASEEGETNMAEVVIAKKHVSLKFGVVGSGQAGGRIAEVFSKYGYDVCAINTAAQDLEFLDIDKDRKYLIDNKELGGTGKDLDISAQAFEEQENQIRDFIDEKIPDADVIIIAASGAGGTGSGSLEQLTTWMYDTGKPVIVIYVLPGTFDDTQGKFNAATTLDTLSGMCEKGMINSLILVDNAAIENAYPNLPASLFWKTANEAAVKPLHLFNSVSVSPTKYDAFDDMDFGKSLLEAGGYCLFGHTSVEKDWYENDETALMESVVVGLEKGLLAKGFDLKEAQTVGVLVLAKDKVLENVPYTNINYMFKYISDEFVSAKTFKGIYGVPADNDNIDVYFMLTGLGSPKSRIDALKTDAEKHMAVLAEKKQKTKIGTSSFDSDSKKIERSIERIKKKNSGIGKLLGAKKPMSRRR